MVAWRDSNHGQARAQRVAANGAFIGTEFPLSSLGGVDTSLGLAADANGNFLATFSSTGTSGNDGSAASIQARGFDGASGLPNGAEIQVNVFTPDNQVLPKATVAADGSIVVVWQSLGSAGSDASASSVQARRLGGSVPVELTSFVVE